MQASASRFLDADVQEDLGILTREVRSRKLAQDAATSYLGDTPGPAVQPGPAAPLQVDTQKSAATAAASPFAPAAEVARTTTLTDTTPTHSATNFGLDLGPGCQQCGGMMQRTGACYTCSSCGFNTGCG